MTHTRGPWHIAKRSNGIAIEHREEKSYGWLQHEVALVYPLAEPEKATGAANARLIAAAPDMLAAIVEVLAAWDMEEDTLEHNQQDRLATAIEALRELRGVAS